MLPTRLALCCLVSSLPLMVACSPAQIDVVAQHTVQTGPSLESDVVWLMHKRVLYRCSAPGGAARCNPVQEMR